MPGSAWPPGSPANDWEGCRWPVWRAGSDSAWLPLLSLTSRKQFGKQVHTWRPMPSVQGSTVFIQQPFFKHASGILEELRAFFSFCSSAGGIAQNGSPGQPALSKQGWANGRVQGPCVLTLELCQNLRQECPLSGATTIKGAFFHSPLSSKD